MQVVSESSLHAKKRHVATITKIILFIIHGHMILKNGSKESSVFTLNW